MTMIPVALVRRLEQLNDDRHLEALERVLLSLGSAVQTSEAYLQEVRSWDDPEYLDVVLDDEAQVVESLLGTAFVATQAHISHVVSIVLRITEILPLKGIGNKQDILRLHELCVGDTDITEAQLIDAAANYFKHRDEWPASWCRLTGQRRKTADIIEAAGATEGSTGNLRTISEALENPAYENMQEFGYSIRRWQNDLFQCVTQHPDFPLPK